MTEADWPLLGPSLNDFGGDWPKYLAHCNGVFQRTLVYNPPRWPIDAKPFQTQYRPSHDGKAATFWHLISEGDEEEDRTPDLARLERIAWPRQLINSFIDAYPESGL